MVAPVPSSLPAGTVTFLFSDIEDSTRLWEEMPAEMAAALEIHDGIVRGTIEQHGGYVFATGATVSVQRSRRPRTLLKLPSRFSTSCSPNRTPSRSEYGLVCIPARRPSEIATTSAQR